MPVFTETLVDTHCHLDFPVFDEDRDEVINKAKQAHINHIVLPAVTRNTWKRLKRITETDNTLHAAYGLHPMFIDKHHAEDIAMLGRWLESEHAIAVGECGLDFFVRDLDKNRQLDFFAQHLKLASEFDLPLIIHARKSLDVVLKHIRQYSGLRGVIHSFSGSEQQAFQCIDAGFHLGFGGPATYPRANKLRRLIASLPLESLLLETDSPDQPDAAHYGQRNEPGFLINIAATFAELRGCSIDRIAEVTTTNAIQLFGLDKS